MNEKPALGPNPTINVEQLAKDRAEWVAAGFPVTTPENDPDPTEV